MNNLKLNFAAWNMKGLTKDFKKCPTIEARINRILEHDELNFIFLQELPNPKKMTIEKLKNQADKWRSCRTPDYCRGVLFFQNTQYENLTVTPIEQPKTGNPPVWVGYSFKKGAEVLFNFFGFWNIPEEGDYWDALLELLEIIPQDAPCILAGDTNVCIQSQGSPSAGFSQEKCNARKADLQEKILPAYNLALVDGTLNNQFTWFNHTGRAHSEFRCDLLIVSECLKKHITAASLGTAQEYMENKGSDHLPLFFTYEK